LAGIEEWRALIERAGVADATAPARIASTVRFAEATCSTKLPASLVEWLFIHVAEGSYAVLADFSANLSASVARASEDAQEVTAFLQLEPEAWSGTPSLARAPIAHLIRRIDRALGAPEALEALASFQRVEDSFRAHGCGDLLRAFRTADEDYRDLREAFEAVFYRSGTEVLLGEDPLLRQHAGQSHEAVRRRFQQLDREVTKLAQRALANRQMGKQVPEGIGQGPRGTWTEGALVRHQLSLQRRHAPLRVLMERAGNAVRALKPCFMMSPMSVAQFLSPALPAFDLVVMDEASQMKPEDALGAIARARQVVIVGDPHQLPPTTFFEKVDAGATDDEESEELGIDGQESILDLASSSFSPLRTLNWHYRSRHGSLIAFSNQEFYDGRLIVFPSSSEKSAHLGVQLVQVDGTYAKGINEKEADAVIDAVLEFAREKPEWSLAIVTMNVVQRDLIAQKLDAALAATPHAEAYRSVWAGGLEPLIVKNLENIQGDERDAVFVSTVYGRDGTGTFAQRYGPINREMGHRRLNVLFTRAKCLMRVFTSMSPDMIKSEGVHRGVRVLRDYLQYAKEGRLAPTEAATSREPDSEFERWFIDRLTGRGYEVMPQYGVAGYLIDLAIRHPDRPGTFLMGVECDGATYHSSKSARERDRLRQEILERLGWRLHRVWSTDWLRNPEREFELLLEKMDALRRADATAGGG
jgi:very-short-patch-repair endonuclease